MLIDNCRSGYIQIKVSMAVDVIGAFKIFSLLALNF